MFAHVNQPGGTMWGTAEGSGPSTHPVWKPEGSIPGPGGSHPGPGGSHPGPRGGWPNSTPGGYPGCTPGGFPPGPGGYPGCTPGGFPPGPGGYPGCTPGGFPAGPGGYPGCTPGGYPSAPSSTHRNLCVPFKETLIIGVYDKLLITICGTIKSKANKLTVDLCKNRDIAFHFNARFKERAIVRNSFIQGRWGREERELQHFPFVPGQPFEMKILCTASEYKVAVNNAHLLSYRHRIKDLSAITSLSIYFDLDLTKVFMGTLP